MSLIDLRGRSAVVTGGSRGVGRATAFLLAKSGANVGIGYRNREEDALEVVDRLCDFGVKAWAQQGDLSKSDDVNLLFERADREFETLDFFIGNAEPSRHFIEDFDRPVKDNVYQGNSAIRHKVAPRLVYLAQSSNLPSSFAQMLSPFRSAASTSCFWAM